MKKTWLLTFKIDMSYYITRILILYFISCILKRFSSYENVVNGCNPSLPKVDYYMDKGRWQHKCSWLMKIIFNTSKRQIYSLTDWWTPI